MSKSDYPDIEPCTIIRTVKAGFRVETANWVGDVERSRVVPTWYGHGLIKRPEKAAENQK